MAIRMCKIIIFALKCQKYDFCNDLIFWKESDYRQSRFALEAKDVWLERY